MNSEPACGWRGRRMAACLLLCLAASTALARQGAPPPSLRRSVQPLQSVSRLVLPATDAAQELAADAKIGHGAPLRFAVPSKVHVTPATHGTWEALPDGRLWRLRLASDGATDLNLGFGTFWLPDGATLHLIAESEDYFQGPFTACDNKPHGQLWTPVVPGGSLVIELFVPSEGQQEPQLVLTKVGAGYRNLFRRAKGFSTPKAGDCNIDVVCPQAVAWRNEIRSVAWYSISGEATCSGTLIGNTADDFRPYFLTADHCELNSGNAASVVVYWNYQSPTCGQHGGGSLSQNQSGAIFRAARADVDVALIELEDLPEPEFQVHYAGWDRSGVAPPGCVGIHHPSTDEKSISFSSNAVTTTDNCIGTGGSSRSTHWEVIWTTGVTEPGSSGSGIWDPATHLLIGFLSGGDSSCSTPQEPDCYGKISVAWNGSSASTRLKDWLDPLNLGVTSLAGRDPVQAPKIEGVSVTVVSESCSPTNGAVDPGESVTVKFALENEGSSNTVNLVATLLASKGVIAPGPEQIYGVVKAEGPSVERAFTFTADGSCGSTISPQLRLQDGTNDLGTVTFNLDLGTPLLALSQNFDGVSAPALPAGWTASVTGSGNAWATSTTQRDTWPNAAFASGPPSVTDNRLTSPFIQIDTADAEVAFRHRYNLESSYDGGVLEISINGGPFNDILDGDCSFVNNGYNATLSTEYSSPLAGRSAWSGNSGGFVTTAVKLPSSAAGALIQLRWRLGTDSSVSSSGWSVDTLSVLDGYSCSRCLASPLIMNVRAVPPDSFVFSFTTATGQAYLVESKTNVTSTNWVLLQTNSGDGAAVSFTNSTAGDGERYFRVRTE
ncbi:MAG: trypsin-like peptidase domain-containing protein [Verrucomicrobia bacterium]|nr:trypsin-like peptidase domain-containing protein [Verrucomicrobiota bacterium]